MKNRKTLPTSRQQARRRGLIALVLALLLLFTLLLRYYSTLTPTQVIRTAEASVGVDRTHILEQRTEGGITFTLSRNDEILMVTSYSPKVRQSTDVGQPLLAVDLTHGTDVAAFGAAWPQESRPIYDSAQGETTDAEEPAHGLQCAGIITGYPEATTVRLCRTSDWYLDVLDTEILEAEDHTRYFWVSSLPSSASDYYDSIILLDQAGHFLWFCNLTKDFAGSIVPTS